MADLQKIVDELSTLTVLEAAELDWAGFFPFSREDATPAATMDGAPPPELVAERISELTEVQDRVTHARRHALDVAQYDSCSRSPSSRAVGSVQPLDGLGGRRGSRE